MTVPTIVKLPEVLPSPAEVLDEVETISYRRSPSDVLRTLVYATATVVLVVLAAWAEDAILGFEEDAIALLTFLTPTAERVLAGLMAIAVAVVGVGYLVVPLVTRRYRLFGYVVAAGVVSAWTMQGIEWWLDRESPVTLVNEVAERGGLSDDLVTTWGLAQLVAVFVVLAPFVSRRWRRFGGWLLALVVVIRLIVAVHLPLTIFVSLTWGAAIGAATLYAFGRPDRRPRHEAIVRALRRGGLPLADLEAAAVDARGSTPYFGTLDDGSRVFVKVLGGEERAADLMFRAYRYLRFKDVGDERPFSSLRRTVEHEALVALYARDVGIRTPRLRSVVDVGADSMVLAYDLINGGSLDRVDPAEIDDGVLANLWGQAGNLLRQRIAHRDLRLANVFVDDVDQAWIIDFGFSEVAATDELLAADTAQLLASLTVAVGAERAVDTAITAIGVDAVADALPRLQPQALSGATQEALKNQSGALDELRETATKRCGVEKVTYDELRRVTPKSVLTIVMLAAVTYFLLPQLADLPGIVDQIKDANWAWAVPVLIASIITYIGASIAMAGSVPEHLRAGPTFAAQVGSSFASKLAPASVGGMALNVRFLQRSGVDSAVASSGVGLNAVSGVVVHLTLLVVFAAWAGDSAFDSIHLPDWHIFAYGILIVAAITAVALAMPSVRRIMIETVLPILKRSIGGVTTVLRSPAKFAMLLGGSAVVTLSYVLATYFSTRAFGGALPLATIGVAYLAGAAVATAAPTPGGLGALEVAVVAALVAAGMDHNIAVPAVFLYRLATFWLPILPGWFAFDWLRHEEYI